MSNNFHDLLNNSPDCVIIMDGGMGTSVEDRGIEISTTLWGSFALLTAKGREINDAIHRDFVNAGAEILITNSHNLFLHRCKSLIESGDFDLTQLLEFKEDSNDPEASACNLHKYLIRSAVNSASAAIPDNCLISVVSCIGSVDDPYATESSVASTEVTRQLEIELTARMNVGSDLTIIETLTTKDEVEGAAQAAINCKPTVFAVGLTCGEDGRTLGGVTIQEAVDLFSPVNPKAYFIQCTRFDLVEKALVQLKKAVGSTSVIGVYANDGRGWNHVKMEWCGDRISPEQYGEYALRWRDAGARIIGGCCGTRPDHIAYLNAILNP